MKILFVAALCTLLIVVYSDNDESQALTSKIIGGRCSQKKYVASIKHRNRHVAAAALVSNKHAITCGIIAKRFKRPYFELAHLTVGSIYHISVPHYFEDIIFNDDFHEEMDNPDANFAIIRLKVPIGVAENAEMLSLSPVDVGPGTQANILGWGSSNFSLAVSGFLKELNVRITSRESCLEYHNELHPSQICATASSGLDEHPYYADLGDPLVSEDGYLIGVLIYLGLDPNIPTIYIKLFPYNNYIMTMISPPGPQEEIDITTNHYEFCDSDDK